MYYNADEFRPLDIQFSLLLSRLNHTDDYSLTETGISHSQLRFSVKHTVNMHDNRHVPGHASASGK